MESLTPNIFVTDINRTIAYYTMLGFTVTFSVPESGDIDWVMMTNGNVTMMFQTFKNLGDDLPDVKRTGGGSLLLYVKMKGILPFFESIKEKVNVIQEMHKTFYGATEFAIKDCNDYIITFAEDL